MKPPNAHVGDKEMQLKRSRLHYAILTALVIVAGCASRSALSDWWHPFVREYSGDTLWSLMVFLGLGFLFPRLSTRALAAIVLMFAFGIELSQLYRAEWIDAFRETFLGAVMIGSGFLWSDFGCYTVGCAMGVAGEMAGKTLHERRRQQEDRQLSSESAPCGSSDEVSS
jgi:hypothetical protein